MANPVEGLAFVQALQNSPPLYAAVETAHTLGFVVLVGAVFFFDLRVLGAARHIPVTALARLLMPWSWAALLVIVPTGLVMFAVNAVCSPRLRWVRNSRNVRPPRRCTMEAKRQKSARVAGGKASSRKRA